MRISLRSLVLLSMFVYATAASILGGIPEAGSLLASAAGLVVISFAVCIFERSEFARLFWFWLPYACFSFWAILSLTWSVEAQTERALTLIQVVLIGLLCAQAIARTGAIEAIEGAFYIGIAASLIVSSPSVGEFERQGGVLGHANDLATLIAGASVFASRRAVLTIRAPRFKAWGLIFSLAMMGACFYLAFYVAGSRRAIVVLGLCMAFLALQWALFARTVLRKVVGVVASGVGMLLIIPLAFESRFFFRLESMLSYLSGGALIREQSLSVRSAMAESALKLWQGAPLTGSGLDNFRHVAGFGTYSHNNYLELLAGLGLIGALLFYVPLILIFGRVLMRSRAAPGDIRINFQWLSLVGLVYLVSDAFSVSYYDKLAWLLLSVLLGYGTWLSKRSAPDSERGG